MAEQGFTLTSPDFPRDAPIPAGFTCDGRNRPPKLEWMHPPEGTRSFALIVDDPDAPGGTFTHWVAFDIPASTASLAQGKPVAVEGRNDFGAVGYGGPCPPANHGEHRYYFRLHALDVESLDLPAESPREQVEQAMQDHVLDTAELMGRYARTPG